MSQSVDFTHTSDTLIGHLGLVAGTYDELGIGAVTDSSLPKTRSHTLTHGDILKLMLLNGLGFVERRLYLYPEFFDGISLSHLLKKDVDSSSLNDDLLGRTLDAIAEYGPTRLFNQIVAKSLINTELGKQYIHVDTTNFSVNGDYDEEDNTTNMAITYGHPKDGRYDLKRFVLGVASNQHGIPLFLQSFSGNESDKETLRIIMENLQANLNPDESYYYVADSAFYTSKNLNEIAKHGYIISRVPQTISEVKVLLSGEYSFQPCQDERYSYAEFSSTYAGIAQKWVLYNSSPMHEKMILTFDKNLSRDFTSAKRSLKKLCSREFACAADAAKEADVWISAYPLYQYGSISVGTVARRIDGKRGRPGKDEEMRYVYTISADIVYNEDKVEDLRSKCGRFVLATNDESMTADELLLRYKNQGVVERGFRFLKDPSFRVSEVYLKKNSRIQALCMVMVLCLFIYSLIEYKLRRELEAKGKTVKSQVKKDTQKPTAKWVFFKFRNVRELVVEVAGETKRLVIGMNEELELIISLLGGEVSKYYR